VLCAKAQGVSMSANNPNHPEYRIADFIILLLCSDRICKYKLGEGREAGSDLFPLSEDRICHFSPIQKTVKTDNFCDRLQEIATRFELDAGARVRDAGMRKTWP
jgi:hypothetical protein